MKPTWRGPVEAIPKPSLSAIPTSRLPLKIPSTETVGYQKRYAVTARCSAASACAVAAVAAVGKPASNS